MASEQPPVLIIGAGVVGLTLAQALKKERIPFRIFERDEHIDARGHGWGITIWALDSWDVCLPASLLARLPEAEVNPAEARRNRAKFMFLNLKTGQPLYQVQVKNQRRLNREKIRKLLLNGIDVEWNKSIMALDPDADDGVRVTFQDGTSVTGSTLRPLPIRFLGVTIKLTPEEIKPLSSLDPMLFQGTHPETGTFMWYSLLDTPETNGTKYYRCQLNVSWPVQSPEDEVPDSNSARLDRLRKLSEPFDERFRAAFNKIPDNTEAVEIKLRDWPCLSWPTFGGKVTLAGDAAHAMVMYRGEGANHGITDACELRDQLVEVWKSKGGGGDITQAKAIENYEAGMRPRSIWSVEMSRQACIDAHDFSRINGSSALSARNTRFRVTGGLQSDQVPPPEAG
ncbi:FAD/NAD(P)-binding domain-containing protein [Pleurostoma richardsiae]|uniref:FAD/NAD(P)-binding domain-containing protein n=1 Tax=Pleurostoma richardsiae TaxID=41990 RepID=A0AA38R2Q4_9PEZI|nr:FAD/NAD(P)-binding domain-containing protein [Pleurostoma richardsiae]